LGDHVRSIEGGVELEVVVQPRASRTRLAGLHDGRLKIQLAASPVDGEANAALVEFVAEVLDVPRRQVTLVRGDTSRRKTVRALGVAEAAARAALEGAGR
jgi:hypothetical protein